MSQAYIDTGIYPGTGYISGAPGFVPEFVLAPTDGSSTANSLWVSLGGNANNSGNSIAPFATINEAILKRQTMSSTTLITINVLSGTYTTPIGGDLGSIVIPCNTAIIGIPCGQTNNPVIYNGVFRPITASPSATGKVIISGLVINGEVRNQFTAGIFGSLIINQCIITSPGGPSGQRTGTAVEMSGGRLTLEDCSVFSPTASANVPVIRAEAESLTLRNCTVKNTELSPSAFPCGDVVFTTDSLNITIDKCNIGTDYNSTSNSPRLCHFKFGTSAVQRSVSVTNSNLTYPSAAIDGNKVCIFFDGTTAVSAAVKSTISNCLLYCPGTTNAVVNSVSIVNTMTQGGNLCAPGANSSAGISAVPLVGLST
jgi:hypothetical protein